MAKLIRRLSALGIVSVENGMLATRGTNPVKEARHS